MNKILVCLFIIFSSVTVYAQNEYDNETPPSEEEEFVGYNKKKNKSKKDLSRLRIGPSLGFALANNQIGFNISPVIGYQVVEDRLEFGAGMGYDFYRYKDPRYKFTVHTPGVIGYGRVYVWQGLFAQAKGVYNWDFVNDNGFKYDPTGYGNIFGGAGYQIKAGERFFMNIGLEINILPYDQSIIGARAERVISPFFNFQIGL